MGMVEAPELLILALVGAAIGFVGGLTGLVLGVVRFPIILGVEVSAAMTAGTNLGVSTLGACTAAIRHLTENNFHRRIFIIMASTGAAGAFMGSLFTRYMPVAVLLLIIAAIVSYESFILIRDARRKNNLVQSRQTSRARSRIVESVIGLGVGFLGGLVGLVLGSIRLPAMISVLKMEPKVAIGTNLAAASIMGGSGLIGHIVAGNIDYYVLAAMGPAAMAGGYMGARYTNMFSASALKTTIGIILIPVAAVLLLRAFSIF
ncbi:MAG: sulfite exporter TauE/SafE family protein [Nitrososphaera sp.]|nr:sulfite exporter TauE/SafE family protein [Nitrososphaera sp.]